MTKDETLQKALDALGPTPPDCCGCQAEWQIAITAIKEALAQPEMRKATREEKISNPGVYEVPVQPEQRPVACEQFYPDIGKPQIAFNAEVIGYIAPQRTWVGLTDEEIAIVEDEYIVDYRIPAGSAWNFAKDIEAKLEEKNT